MKRFILAALLAACSTETVGLDPAQDAADGGVFMTRQASVIPVVTTINTSVSFSFDSAPNNGTAWKDSAVANSDHEYGTLRAFPSGWDVEVFGRNCQYFTFSDCTPSGQCPVPHNCTVSRLNSYQTVPASNIQATWESSPCTLNLAYMPRLATSKYTATFNGPFSSDTWFVRVFWVPINPFTGAHVWEAQTWYDVQIANVGSSTATTETFNRVGMANGGDAWWDRYAGHQLSNRTWPTCFLDDDCEDFTRNFIQIHQACWSQQTIADTGIQGDPCTNPFGLAPTVPFTLDAQCGRPGVTGCCPH